MMGYLGIVLLLTINMLPLFASAIVVQEQEIITIGIPLLQCNENGQITESFSNTTTFKLPANSKALYSFKSNSSIECKNTQRCTLMTWKTLREFERYLILNYEDTKTGLVEFDNNMLLPGFNYTLHVTLKPPSGEIVEKRIIVIYPHEKESHNRTDETPLVTLSLQIGTSFVYSTMPLFVNAKVVMCSNTLDYFWKIVPNIIEIEEKGSELTIENIADYFQPTTLYFLKCELVDSESNMILAEKVTDITMKNPPEEVLQDFHVYLPFQKTTVNLNSPITISGFVKTVMETDNSTFWVKWSCLYGNESVCSNRQELTLDLENGFSKEGTYFITLTVSNKTFSKIANCTVEVVKDMPSILLDVKYPIRQIEAIEIRAVVDELRTYCSVQWLSEGQFALDLDSIPGFNNKIFNISSKDKTFLSDMEEFGIITVSKEFTILIPSPSSSWAGLNDSTYNISIAVTCPALSKIKDLSEVTEKAKHFLTISAWAIIEVEPPPELNALEIAFEKQIAVRSKFTYKVEPAKEKDLLSYQYGYRFGDLEVIFYSGLNVYECETTLPYDKGNPVETFVIACDYFKNCGKIFGSNILPQLDSTISTEDFERNLRQKFARNDFDKAVIYAITYITTFSDSELKDPINDIVVRNIVEKLQSYAMDSYNSSNETNTFLKNDANDFLTALAKYSIPLNLPKYALEEIVKLKDRTLKVQDDKSYKLRKLLEADDMSLDTIKSSMDVSELIITHSHDKKNVDQEKEHLIKTLHYYLAKLCAVTKFTREIKIEMKTVLFSMQRWSARLNKQFLNIPFDHNSWNETAKINIATAKLSNKICLGKLLFKNYFNVNDSTFGVKIFDGTREEEVDGDFNVTILLPISQRLFKNNSVKCTVYSNGWIRDCLTNKYYEEFVQCVCPSTGYIFTEIKNLADGNMYIENKHNVALWDIIENNNIANDRNHTFEIGSMGEKISFVIIASCLVGFIILSYIIKKLLSFLPHGPAMEHHNDEVYYGNLLQEEPLR